MKRGRLERLFERWRRKRDVRALARVFDATSRELLELAGHVSHDPSEAEDLVQATFLAAIESAERFDMERDLVAWLVGILVREARMSRRRAARRPDPDRLSERGEADPADAAERIELSEVLRAALDRLPPPYREVVGPYVRDGASPSHIAHALGRSPGTVRVQIHRGLELVRRELPAGVVAGALLAALPTRGLAAIRESVLARATSLAGSALATGAATTALVPLGLGGLVVKKLVVAASVVVAAAVAWAWFAAGPRAGSAFPSERAIDRQVLAQPRNVAPSGEPVIVAPAQNAERTEQLTAAPSGETTQLATLRVHLVWASDGSPAAGVGARLGRIAGAEEGERTALADARGLALFDEVEPGSHAVRIDRVQVQEIVELDVGEAKELQISVPDGLTVEGKVLDAERQGLADVDVLLSDPWTLGGVLLVARSASDGSFRFRGATNYGAVSAQKRGWIPALQASLHQSVAGAGPIVAVDVVLDRRSGALEGRVLDADGRPVEGAQLTVGSNLWQADPSGQSVFVPMVTRSDGWLCRPPEPARTTSDSEGSFSLADVETGEVEVRVRAAIEEDGAAPQFLPEWSGQIEVRAEETARLEVRLARGAAVEGVVRFADGSPAANVGVRAMDRPGSLGRYDSCDGEGSFRITGLQAGTLALSANDSSRLGHSPARTELAVADGETGRWEVTLPKAASLECVAVDEHWKGLEGWSVRVTQRGKFGYEAWPTTDAEGRCNVDVAEGEAYDLELLPPGADREAAPHAWVEGARPGEDEIVLQVSDLTRPSAFVRGVLLGPDGAPPKGGNVGASRARFPQLRIDARTAEDGAFEVGPLPPGAYTLDYLAADCPRLEQELELAPREAKDVGVLRLQAPGDVAVRIRGQDVVTPEEIKVVLHGQGQPRELDRLPSGAWLARKVPAGKHVLTVESSGWPQVRREIELAEGGALELQVELARGAVCPVLVVLPADVHDKVFVTVTVRDTEGAISQEIDAVTDGFQPIDTLVLAPGEWTVEVQQSSNGWTGAARVIVPSDGLAVPVLTIALEPPR